MYWLNKIVAALTSPAVLGLVLLLLGFLATALRRRRAALALQALGVLWFALWLSPATSRLLGRALERDFPVVAAEDAPAADAIVTLGGGVAARADVYPYPELWPGADRAWHAARLYKAGKAPRVYVTGGEACGTPQFLEALGVPRAAIETGSAARNTEGEARYLAAQGLKRILLVTSVWHMRRALLTFRKYAPGVEVVPAATDYETLVRFGADGGMIAFDLVPDAESFARSSLYLKEIVGYWGYRCLRR